MTRLEEIEQERSALLRQLDALQFEKTKLLMEKHGIEIGMLAEYQGKVYRVTGARFLDWGSPWLLGNPKLKDGSFGKQERTIYTPWKKVSA